MAAQVRSEPYTSTTSRSTTDRPTGRSHRTKGKEFLSEVGRRSGVLRLEVSKWADDINGHGSSRPRPPDPNRPTPLVPPPLGGQTAGPGTSRGRRGRKRLQERQVDLHQPREERLVPRGHGVLLEAPVGVLPEEVQRAQEPSAELPCVLQYHESVRDTESVPLEGFERLQTEQGLVVDVLQPRAYEGV